MLVNSSVKSDTEYFDTYFDLFTHPGWQLFVSEIEEELDHHDKIYGVTTEQELYLHKGKVEVYRRILGLKDTLEAAQAWQNQ